jgi:hydrogenase maturation factor HypF (carbamoyltransferase family)
MQSKKFVNVVKKSNPWLKKINQVSIIYTTNSYLPPFNIINKSDYISFTSNVFLNLFRI